MSRAKTSEASLETAFEAFCVPRARPRQSGRLDRDRICTIYIVSFTIRGRFFKR